MQVNINDWEAGTSMKITGSGNEHLFFSVVIPAHQEEGYIEKTIRALEGLDYPREKLEVIIVENGSKDRTAEILRTTCPDWFHVLSTQEMGVSKAKNLGIEQLKPESDWVIFLDADVLLGQGFLNEFNAFLHNHEGQNLGCGMLSLLPYPDSRKARVWYRFYNFANKTVRTTRSIQLIRRDLLKDLRFDEALTFDEDTFLLRQCIARSKFFFMKTDKVLASTRRFERNGWVRQLAEWIYFASRSYEKKKTIKYRVLR
jgi:glycosyltransferase involved in cell wall biosynthesis